MDKQFQIQDFPEEGAPTLNVEVPSYYFDQFPQNCMKMK